MMSPHYRTERTGLYAVLACAVALLCAAHGSAQIVVTPVFVHKDGHASSASASGTGKTIMVDGGGSPVTGWATFQTSGVDVSHIGAHGSATLVLYVTRVGDPGTLTARMLTAPITVPEGSVPIGALRVGAAVDSVKVTTDDAGMLLRLDITRAIETQGAGFSGIALTSADEFRIELSAKEGDLGPMVLLTHDPDGAAGTWHAGSDDPDGSLGDAGDYYLCRRDGRVYVHDGSRWTLETSIMGPAGADDPRILRWRGEWSATTQYDPFDVVAHNGNTYFTPSSSLGENPALRGGPWTVLALRGTSGTTSWTEGASELHTTGRVGLGVAAPEQHLSVSGNATVSGDLIADAQVGGSVEAVRVTGLLGSGFELQGRDAVNNAVEMVMDGIDLPDPAVVIRGPAIEIDRLPVRRGTRRWDHPGLSMEAPLIVEVDGTGAANLTSYFDLYASTPGTRIKHISLIVRSYAAEERVHWVLRNFAPAGYADIRGHRRFTFEHTHKPNGAWACSLLTADFSGFPRPSYNHSTDNAVEIEGIHQFAPMVEVDTVARTVTMTYLAAEGCPEMVDWTHTTLGLGGQWGCFRSMSILVLTPVPPPSGSDWMGTGYYEESRTNYFECFPISHEVLRGFHVHTELVERVVLAYEWRDSP